MEKEQKTRGGIDLLTDYIASITGLQKDFAEDIAYDTCSKIDEIIFTRVNKCREEN